MAIKTDELHAFFGIDAEGNETLLSRYVDGQPRPLIAVNKTDLIEIEILAVQTAQERRIGIRHAKFTRRVEVKEVLP